MGKALVVLLTILSLPLYVAAWLLMGVSEWGYAVWYAVSTWLRRDE